MLFVNIKRLGFTMIELLVVIAIIGILAVGLLSAINPVEQINKSNDTATKAAAKEFVAAAERYYTTKQYYPWQVASGAGQAVAWFNLSASTSDPDGATATQIAPLPVLISSSEMKSNSVTAITKAGANSEVGMYLSMGATTSDNPYLCFKPRSGAGRAEAYARCVTSPTEYPTSTANSGPCPTAAGSCDSATATGCYICVP